MNSEPVPPTRPFASPRARKLDLVFGVFIPGIILGPMLLFGLLGMVVTGANAPAESRDVMGILVGMSLAGMLALGAVAVAVLAGPERIRRHAALRYAVAIALVAGIVVAGFALWAQRSSVMWSARADLGALVLTIPGLIALGGPIVVALRYLPALLKR